MAKLKSLSVECDNCGAKLSPADDTGTVTCEYCGHRFEVQRPPPGPVAPAPRPTIPPAEAPARAAPALTPEQRAELKRKAKRGGLIVGLVVLLIVGGITTLILYHALSEDMIWDDVGGRPQIVTISGAEHVIGRVRSISDDHELSIIVVDAATGEVRWRSPALGTYSDASHSVRFAAKAGRLVASDRNNVLHFYELATGQELKTLGLTDKVEQLCTAVEDDAVWARVADKRHAMIDLKGLAIAKAPPPASCPEEWEKKHNLSDEEAGRAPRVEGFAPKRVLVEGELGVAAGVRHPGTELPLAVGFDPRTKAVRWKRRVALGDQTKVQTGSASEQCGLAGGRFVVAYAVGDSRQHVTAFDARSGTRQWEVELRDVFAVDQVTDLQLTGGYVYLVHASTLEVLDAGTGELLATIGDETYE